MKKILRMLNLEARILDSTIFVEASMVGEILNL